MLTQIQNQGERITYQTLCSRLQLVVWLIEISSVCDEHLDQSASQADYEIHALFDQWKSVTLVTCLPTYHIVLFSGFRRFHVDLGFSIIRKLILFWNGGMIKVWKFAMATVNQRSHHHNQLSTLFNRLAKELTLNQARNESRCSKQISDEEWEGEEGCVWIQNSDIALDQILTSWHCCNGEYWNKSKLIFKDFKLGLD